MSNSINRHLILGSLLIVALGATVWSAVAHAGVTPTPTAAPTSPPSLSSGSVVGWGVDADGEATPPDAVNGVLGTAIAIAAGGEESAVGSEHSCAIQAPTGNVICWGNNIDGQSTPPNAVNGVSGTATHIAAGGIHSCAIQSGTASAVCWGFDRFGQSTPPGSVNGASGIATHIAAGGFHSCAIRGGTSSVVCWGSNFYGPASPPNAVNGVSGTATEIATGIDHSCAIQAVTGSVVCWGRDNFGQVTTPDAVNGVSGTAIKIAAGGFHNCAIQAVTGNVICWGSNSRSQSHPPDDVGGASGTAVEIAAGLDHSCAIQAVTGNVVCWGRKNFGQSIPPDAVNGVSGTATDIAAGGNHTLAMIGSPPGQTPTPSPTATPTLTPTPSPTDTPTPTPAPLADCLCEVQNINPNQVVLQKVGTGGKGSDTTRKISMILNAVDAPGATCDPGEFSAPTRINLRMEDDGGNLLIDSSKIIVCEHGGATILKRDVFFQGPLNCENGAVPASKPGFSLGTITSTGSASGTADYVESTGIKCFE